MTAQVLATYDIISDLAANRPATPTVANGRLCVFMATDTGVISIWNGSAWNPLPTHYEEGTWTPVDGSGASPAVSFTISGASYTRIGRAVTANYTITYGTTTDGNFCRVAGLPFALSSGFNSPCANQSNNGFVTQVTGNAGTSNMKFTKIDGTADLTNTQMSGKFSAATIVYW